MKTTDVWIGHLGKHGQFVPVRQGERQHDGSIYFGGGGGSISHVAMTCLECHEAGEVRGEPCTHCEGRGTIISPIRFNISSTASLGEEDDMCPNCQTPWKCNGPHILDGSKDS